MNGRSYLQMQLACAEIDASVFFELSFLVFKSKEFIIFLFYVIFAI